MGWAKAPLPTVKIKTLRTPATRQVKELKLFFIKVNITENSSVWVSVSRSEAAKL